MEGWLLAAEARKNVPCSRPPCSQVSVPSGQAAPPHRARARIPLSGAAFRPAVIPSRRGLSSATATETGDDANGSGKKPSRHGKKERGQTRRPSCASFHQKVVVQGVLLQE